MKKLIFIVCIFLGTLKLKANDIEFSGYLIPNNLITDTAVYPISSFININLTFYNNQSVSLFLSDLNELFPGYLLSKVHGGDNGRIGSRLQVYFANNITFRIIVKDFTHMNPYSPTAEWDIDLYKQENIFKIELYDNSASCVKGCD